MLTPPGRMVDVAGHKMHVYSVGEGDKTLVLMAASGTVCPSLDFKKSSGNSRLFKCRDESAPFVYAININCKSCKKLPKSA